MPPLPSELKMLLDSLIAQIQQVQQRSDTLQTYLQAELDKVRQATEIDALKNTQAVQQEQIRVTSDEIKDLKQQLRETKDEILKAQQDQFKRTIAVQGSLLFLILSTVIGIAVKLLFH